MTQRVSIAYLVAAVLLLATGGVAILANSRVYTQCWVEHPIYVPVENPALCQQQLFLSRLAVALALGFLTALVVAVRAHFLRRRKSATESPNNRWRGP